MRVLTPKTAYLLLIIFTGVLSLAPALYADTELTLIATLPVGTDSTVITSITPIGDFNADGYPDLLIGEGPRAFSDEEYEAAYLYYGGPSFDSIPDLTFMGALLSDFCRDNNRTVTEFGETASGMGDFNGDGFDDLAIGAYGYCGSTFWTGRIYIYFGGTAPDTAVDLILDGDRYADYVGDPIICGDFNGDGLGDLLARAGLPPLGSRIRICFGANPPDVNYDWVYDYGYERTIWHYMVYGGMDLNGDGTDDFGWTYDENSEYYVSLFFLGGDPLSSTPADSAIGNYRPWFPGDISQDGIDDFFLANINGENYLYLGGSPLDMEPDYYSRILSRSFVLNMNDGVKRLASVSTFWDRILLYNVGVPLDTIPIDTLRIPHLSSFDNINVGDINADSTDELALVDTTLSLIYLYSINEITSVSDNPANPVETDLLFSYPNPFNNSVVVVLQRSGIGHQSSRIRIYDIRGHLVNVLKALNCQERRCEFLWDGNDITGNKICSGVYFISYNDNGRMINSKLLLLK